MVIPCLGLPSESEGENEEDFRSSSKRSGENTKSSLRNFYPNVVSEGGSKRGDLPLVSEEVSRVREGAFHQKKLTTR